MPSHLKKKISELHVGENVKKAASALVSDVKEIVSDTRVAVVDTFHHANKNTKKVLRKFEKKLS